MSKYDRYGNRPKGSPDPIEPFKAQSNRWINSCVLLAGSVVWTVGTFIAPAAKPLLPQETHGIVDAVSSGFCKGVDLVGVGILAINTGINYFRTAQAARDFNREEARRQSDERNLPG